MKRIISGSIFKNRSGTAGKKILALLFFTFHFSLFTLHSQDRLVIDSLKKELQNYDAGKEEMGGHSNSLADSNKANILYALALQYWTNKYDTSLYYSQQLLTLAQKINYKKGIGNGYNIMGLGNMAGKNYTLAEDYYRKALKVRTEIGDKTGMAWTWNDLGLMRGNQGDYEDAIRCHLLSSEIKKGIGDREGMAASYGKVGYDYSILGKFPEAVNYYLKALKIEEENGNKNQIGGFYDALGNVYYNEGNYPEALKNFREEIKIANQTGDKLQAAITAFNMGRIYYKLGNDTGAIRFFQAALKKYEEYPSTVGEAATHYYSGMVFSDMGNFTGALQNARSALKEYQAMGSVNGISETYIEIGSIYAKENRLQYALDSIGFGLSLAKQIGAKVEIKDAYCRLADINAAMHNYEAAYNCHKEYSKAADSLSSNESAEKVAILEMNYTFQKKEDSANAEQEKVNIIKTAESKRKNIITGSAIVISLLTILLTIVLLRGQQLKQKKDAVIFENEKQRIELELANAKIMLNEYIQNMEEKNKLLEEFKADVEGFKNIYDKERVEKLEHLNKATILTDEDWNKFKQLFEQVHKDFFKRLKEKLPDLTQAEVRLMCLTKLSLGTKQMAGILGVSLDTIKKSRHRLRKKLGLPEEDSLDDVVNSV